MLKDGGSGQGFSVLVTPTRSTMRGYTTFSTNNGRACGCPVSTSGMEGSKYTGDAGMLLEILATSF